jgi:hypothetical protein
MKQVTLSNQIFDIPECWEEVTVDQLIKLSIPDQRPIEVISIFTLPEKELSNLKDLKGLEEIELCLSFLNTNFDFNKASETRKDKFVFNQVEYSLNADIGNSSIGQYKDLAHIYNEYIKEDDQQTNLIRRFKCYVDAISIYLQPVVNGGEYDYIQAELIANDLYKCSAVEVAAYGSFFIRKYCELKNGILTDVLKTHIPKKKPKQGILYYLKRLTGQLRFTH